MLSDSFIAPDWPAPPNVRAFSTTRLGGVSHPPYDALNLGHHVDDDPQHVQANRARLATGLGLPGEPAWLEQQHGNGVAHLDGSGVAEPIRADAAVALRAGRICAVLTADCLPILLCDTAGTCVAAVHAGWRGLACGVIDTAIRSLAPREGNLLAWLGPAISAAAYEVDEPVRTGLLAACPEAGAAFEPTRPGHWRADLAAVARLQLQRAGVDECFGGDYCTYDDPERFFSHRRDGPCGRMASLIWLAE